MSCSLFRVLHFNEEEHVQLLYGVDGACIPDAYGVSCGGEATVIVGTRRRHKFAALRRLSP
jgi:hypothetical protein